MQGRGEQPAIIYDSPLGGQTRTLTYYRLQVETQVLAAILRNFGVGKGDRVVLYMPMVPEAVMAMLACARIGAVHSVVFGGFAANELAIRIDDAKPKVILSASSGLYFTIRPPVSIPQLADRITFGLASSMRVASSRAAKPPNTTECTAPMRAQASIPMTASGTIGM